MVLKLSSYAARVVELLEARKWARRTEERRAG